MKIVYLMNFFVKYASLKNIDYTLYKLDKYFLIKFALNINRIGIFYAKMRNVN